MVFFTGKNECTLPEDFVPVPTRPVRHLPIPAGMGRPAHL